MNLTQQQKIFTKACIEGLKNGQRNPIGCKASAGTGKTFLLTHLYQELIQNDVNPDSILVMTFSRNATAELKERITPLLAPYQLQPTVLTIHGFLLKILRTYGSHIGLPIALNLLSEHDLKTRLMWEIEHYLLKKPSESLRDFLNKYNLNEFCELLYTITQSQMRSWLAENEFQDLFRCWMHETRFSDIAHRLSQALQGVHLDGNTRLGMWIEDHQAQLLALIQGPSNPSQVFSFLELSESMPPIQGKIKDEPIGEVLRQLKNIRDEYPKTLFDPRRDHDIRKQDADFVALTKDVRQHLEKIKRAHGFCGFTDIEIWAHEVITRFPEAALKLRARMMFVLLDECQDTNARQWSMMQAILGPELQGLVAVGDVKQCLYQFRGADPNSFLEMMKAIESQKGTCFDLEDHFRSTPPLLRSINQLTQKIFPESPQLISHVETTSGRMITKESQEEEWDEALESAILCRQLHDEKEHQWSDLFILVRNLRGVIHDYRNAFQAMGIPLVIDSGLEFFADPLVRFFRHCVAVQNDPDDRLSLFALIQSPFFSSIDTYPIAELFHQHRDIKNLWAALESSPRSNNSFKNHMSALSTFIQCSSPHAMVRQLENNELFHRMIEHSPAPEATWTRWNQLKDMLSSLKALPGMNDAECIIHFLDENRAQENQLKLPRETRANAVTLMTVHAAKGLQARTVILPQMHESGARTSTEKDIMSTHHFCLRGRHENGRSYDSLASLLLKQRSHEEQMLENKRIFYVAYTRARENVFFLLNKNASTKEGAWAGFLPPL